MSEQLTPETAAFRLASMLRQRAAIGEVQVVLPVGEQTTEVRLFATVRGQRYMCNAVYDGQGPITEDMIEHTVSALCYSLRKLIKAGQG